MSYFDDNEDHIIYGPGNRTPFKRKWKRKGPRRGKSHLTATPERSVQEQGVSSKGKTVTTLCGIELGVQVGQDTRVVSKPSNTTCKACRAIKDARKESK